LVVSGTCRGSRGSPAHRPARPAP